MVASMKVWGCVLVGLFAINLACWFSLWLFPRVNMIEVLILGERYKRVDWRT